MITFEELSGQRNPKLDGPKWTDKVAAIGAAVSAVAIVLSPILERTWLTLAIVGIFGVIALVFTLKILGSWITNLWRKWGVFRESTQFMKELQKFAIRLGNEVLSRNNTDAIAYTLQQRLNDKQNHMLQMDGLSEGVYYLDAHLKLITERIPFANGPQEVKFLVDVFDMLLDEVTTLYKKKWHPFIADKGSTFHQSTQQNLLMAREEFARYVRDYKTFRGTLSPHFEKLLGKRHHEVPSPIVFDKDTKAQ